MAVGEGADQPGGDLGAAHRRDRDAQACCSTATSKRAKCISFTVAAVGQQAGQIGAVVAVAAEVRRDELHQVRVAVAGRELHQAEPVAMRIEAHGLGIDRDDGAEGQAFRQVVPVQMDGAAWHELCAAH